MFEGYEANDIMEYFAAVIKVVLKLFNVKLENPITIFGVEIYYTDSSAE